MVTPKPYNEQLHSYSISLRNLIIFVCTLCKENHFATPVKKNHFEHKYKYHREEKKIKGDPNRTFNISEISQFQLAAEVFFLKYFLANTFLYDFINY